MKKIGLALGGGGVRGLAHVPVLELFDELGVKPSIISGSSMGALIGALYASGMSGKTIKERIRQHLISKHETWQGVLKKRSYLMKWVKAFGFERGRGGIVKTDRFLKSLFAEIRETTFEDLDIPLIVIAADFWRAEEVPFSSGKLLPAIEASIAVPGVFAPVLIAGRVLVDGGVVNPVPYDHIVGRCDLSIAVNVAKVRTPGKHGVPSVLDSILGAFDITQAASFAEKMRHRRPDICIHPEIRDVAMFDFTKVESVFSQAGPAVRELRTFIEREIAGRPASGDA
ncbi:MAG: patatin-like phospholipase family protein [Candidatus Eisenbacteria bacterium]|nr:patatin-like phospholipase family protein [Candidatus Eisenbacteria bacterium]